MNLYADHNVIRDMVMKNLSGANFGEIVTMITKTQQVLTYLKVSEEEAARKGAKVDKLLSGVYPEIEAMKKSMEEEKSKRIEVKLTVGLLKRELSEMTDTMSSVMKSI